MANEWAIATATTAAHIGEMWIAYCCMRCQSLFYVHAYQNVDPQDGRDYRLCPWCKGKCSAAEMDRHTANVEAALNGRESDDLLAQVGKMANDRAR